MDIRKLTKELQRKAEQELNEVPARMQDDVQHIREWLHGQPHLCMPDDDQSIVTFLRLCKYGLHKTKERIENFCTMLSLLPDIFTERDPLLPEIQTILNANIFATLPNAEDVAGPRILMIRLSKCNPEQVSIPNLKKVFIMVLAVLMQEDDNSIVGGLNIFVDFEGLSLSYVLQINLGLTGKHIYWGQKANGFRIKQITFINVPSVIEAAYNSVKYLISDKLSKRVNVYSKDTSYDMCKAIPQSILPKEYGGNGGSFEELAAVWKQKIEKYRAFFSNDKLYYANEELRLGRSNTSSELGIEVQMKIRKITKELQRKAEEELNEVPARMQDDVQHIREWLHAQPHLCFPNDDQTIVLFLRLCKHGLNKTKGRIDNFCTMVSVLPHLFTKRDPLLPEMQSVLNANIFATLPNPEDATGPRILMMRLNKCNPEQVSLQNLQKAFVMILAILMQEDDNCIISGLNIFVDFEGFSLSYMLQINIGLTGKQVYWRQKANGLRIKHITFINVPSVIETLHNSVKYLISDKKAKRVNVYSKGNSYDIYKVIPQSILPKEYGGNGGSFDDLAAVWKQKIEKYRAFFSNDKLYYANEELRPRRSNTSSDLGTEVQMKVRKLTKELQRKAEEELNEVPARMQDDVEHIREWLHAQPHLCFPDDDQTIVLFLRLCKYGLHKTKERIDNFCTMVQVLRDIFADRDPLLPEIQIILNANIFATPPNTEDAAGPRILMVRIGKCSPDTMSILNIQKVCTMILYILMNEDDITTIGGLSLLVDFEGLCLSYMLQINLAITGKLIRWMQIANGVRLKHIILINVSSPIETFYNSIKHLLSDKLGRRVHIYSKGNGFEICKGISPSSLPKEYGGNGGSFDELAAVWKQKIESYRSSFLNKELFYANEELRPGRSNISSELGIEGSFRKLEID